MGGSSQNMLLPFNMPPVAKGGMLGFLSGAGGGTGGAVPYWKEIGRATQGAGTSSDALNILDKDPQPYNLIISRMIAHDTGNVVSALRVGDGGSLDTGSNYSRRRKEGSGSASTATNQDAWYTGGLAGNQFQIAYISNIDGQEKLANILRCNANSAGGNPTITQMAGKWYGGTDTQFDSVGLFNDEASGSFGAGSEIIWLGYNPEETTGSSVFSELAYNSLTGTSAVNNSGTLASTEEYLICNEWIEQASPYSSGLVFNGDGNGTTNYDFQYNVGDNYGTNSNTWKFVSNYSAYSDGMQAVTYIMNFDGEEKLGISIGGEVNSSTAGTAPRVSTWACKYEPTGTDITSAQRYQESGQGDLQAGTKILVSGFS